LVTHFLSRRGGREEIGGRAEKNFLSTWEEARSLRGTNPRKEEGSHGEKFWGDVRRWEKNQWESLESSTRQRKKSSKKHEPFGSSWIGDLSQINGVEHIQKKEDRRRIHLITGSVSQSQLSGKKADVEIERKAKTPLTGRKKKKKRV